MNTDEIIFIKLNNIAQQKGVKLTLTNKLFYLKLLKYAIDNGESLDDRYIIEKTEKEMVELFEMPPRTVTQCLQVLTKCGIISRIKGESKFPRKPSKTAIYKEIFEKEGENK